MTSKHNRLGGFEEKLLGELKSVVAQRKAEQSATAPARAPMWRRPRAISVASAGALAIGAAIGVPLLGGETAAPPASAAYTIESNDDGTVTVTIHRWDDAEGLEDGLEKHGVQAEVDYVPEGKRCQPDRGTPSDSAGDIVLEGMVPGEIVFRFTVRPSDFGPDDTLVIENSSSGDIESPTTSAIRLSQAWQVIDGPVEPCEVEDVPPGEIRESIPNGSDEVGWPAESAHND